MAASRHVLAVEIAKVTELDDDEGTTPMAWLRSWVQDMPPIRLRHW